MNKRKKTLLKATCIVLSLFILAVIVVFITDNLKNKDNKDIETIPGKDDLSLPTITFYPADFDENIYENSEYMQKNSYITYTHGGMSLVLTEGKDSTDDRYAEFFVDYFESVKNASDTHKSFFAPEYSHVCDFMAEPDGFFAPQMIYDIEIFKFEAQNDLSLNTDTQYTFFEVKYKIFHNNGTYRRDLPENAAKPLLFQLSDKSGEIKISAITEFSFSE